MTRSTCSLACTLAAVFLFASIDLSAAQATPYASRFAPEALPGLPLTLSSVFCGATGCMPVTRVKRCAPDTVNQGLPGQRAIVVRRSQTIVATRSVSLLVDMFTTLPSTPAAGS